MSLPSSCSKCFELQAPPALLTSAGLCPKCAATEDTAEPTPAAAPRPAADADTPTVSQASEPPTRSAAPEADTVTAAGPPASFHHAPPGYELVRHLEDGGMGDVYLARELPSERLVAIKFLGRPDHAAGFQRFVTELQALAKLDHPNIVRVFASDFLRATPFFTMEYMEGGSLSHAIKAKPLSVAGAVELIRVVAGAVAAAHAADVIHRDLKPSNILLAADGTPKVADFGLAKRLDLPDDGPTHTSSVLGTPGYMPPEQITTKNGDVGFWSDIYGLGATLYHLLTGRAPFVGKTIEEIIPQVLADEPRRPRALKPEIPLPLEAIVVKCLAKEPTERYQTVAAFLADLDGYEAGRRLVAPQLTRVRRAKLWARQNQRHLSAAATAVLVVAGAFALGAAYWPKPKPAPPTPLDPLPAVVARWAAPTAGGPTVADADRVHAQARADLRSGRAFELVSRTEMRVPLGWALGSGTVEPPDADAPLRLTVSGEAVVYFLPDTGLDRYRLRAAVRQDYKTRDADPQVSAAASWAGLVIGHAQVPGAGGRTAHLLTAVQFCECDPAASGGKPDPNHHVVLQTAALASSKLLTTRSHAERPDAYLPLALVAGARPWREFVIDVTPDGVRVRHGGEERFVPAPVLRQGWAAARDRASREWFGGDTLPLPVWQPRLPVGVRVVGCTASVRDVTVEPLP